MFSFARSALLWLAAAPLEGLLTAGQYEQYLKDEDKEIH